MLGTVFCSVKTIAEFDRRGLQLGPSHVSPLDFANSVINAAAGQAAIWHGLRGVNSTISGGEASGLLAIAGGTSQIRGGHADALLAGGAEELCFESFLGHLRAGRLCDSDPLPFDARRALCPGRGPALLMLEGQGGGGAGSARVREVLGQATPSIPWNRDGAARRWSGPSVSPWTTRDRSGDIDAVRLAGSVRGPRGQPPRPGSETFGGGRSTAKSMRARRRRLRRLRPSHVGTLRGAAAGIGSAQPVASIGPAPAAGTPPVASGGPATALSPPTAPPTPAPRCWSAA